MPEPFTCGIGCSLQIDGVGTELNYIGHPAGARQLPSGAKKKATYDDH